MVTIIYRSQAKENKNRLKDGYCQKPLNCSECVLLLYCNVTINVTKKLLFIYFLSKNIANSLSDIFGKLQSGQKIFQNIFYTPQHKKKKLDIKYLIKNRDF